MLTNRREVLALVFEFILSLVMLIGGGFLIYQGKAAEFVTGMLGVVITFWFQRRQAEQIMKSQQNQTAQVDAGTTDPAEAESQIGFKADGPKV